MLLFTASPSENSDHPDAEYVRVSLYCSVENTIQRGRLAQKRKSGQASNSALHQILLGRYQQRRMGKTYCMQCGNKKYV